MATTDSLIAQINRLVEEKTFSLDALSAIEGIKNAAQSAQKELEAAREELKNERANSLRLGEIVAQNIAAGSELAKRVAAVEAREKVMTELEKKAAIADAVSSAQKEMVALVFRNLEVRQSVFGSQPAVIGTPPYVSTANFNQTTETTKT